MIIETLVQTAFNLFREVYTHHKNDKDKKFIFLFNENHTITLKTNILLL